MTDGARSTTRAALDPEHSAAVLASAGTGKTWLLAKRMLRILLSADEMDPGSLLALTFTKRAAGEMRDRLLTYARELASVDDAGLAVLLDEMCLPDDAATRGRARRVLGRLIQAPHPPRIATFHAFCQDLLARFPVEAGIPPGFELLTNERELRAGAWERLMDEASRDADLRDAFSTLFDRFGRPARVRKRLYDLLDRRSEWWAWTEDSPDPVADAIAAVRCVVGAPPEGFDPASELRGTLELRCAALKRALGPVADGEAVKRLDALRSAITQADERGAAAVDDAWAALHVKSTGESAAESKSFGAKKLRGVLGDGGFLRLQREWADAAVECSGLRERVRAAELAELNAAWFRAGARLMEHYQALKWTVRVLDFADLEWQAYRLLNLEGHAEWVQFKLDRRIEHLLVDEFQDTNPTQWRLLKPVLDEMAAGDPERRRSVFIVGDAKQSIYRFRRARPELLAHAAGWLESMPAMRASTHSLALSRRSSPAIMTVVNAVFGGTRWTLPGFTTHDTTEQGIPGCAECVAFTPPPAPEADVDDGALRDPLARGRPEDDTRDHRAEADWIAQRIRSLVETGEPVVRDGTVRPAGWADCMILLRQRTHAHAIEEALQRHGIPYESASRGMLLQRLEVRDLLALLEVLVAPWNDLALAQVLRSPIFAAGDDDLMTLAAASPHRGGWYKALGALADDNRSPALARAYRAIDAWRERVNSVPVHDLVDQMFCEGDIVERFAAAARDHQRLSVRANLERVLELALETDAGRYPTLQRFIERLYEARDAGDEEFDDAPLPDVAGRVRILTVHGAKGLEAPFVFLAQAWGVRRGDGLRVIVDWPADAPRPATMALVDTAAAPAGLESLVADEEAAEAVEDANLLYVALTRARQRLVVSGTEPRRGGDDAWLPGLRECWPNKDSDGMPLAIEHRVTIGPVTAPPVAAAAVMPAALDGRRGGARPSAFGLAPDDLDRADRGSPANRQASLLGTLVHRALELSTPTRHASRPDPESVATRLAAEAGIPTTDPLLSGAMDAVRQVLETPELAWIFDTTEAWNEVAMTADTHGVADRVVLRGDGEVWVIDYKTHANAAARVEELRDSYGGQMARYRALAGAVWPGRRVITALLFTAIPALEVID